MSSETPSCTNFETDEATNLKVLKPYSLSDLGGLRQAEHDAGTVNRGCVCAVDQPSHVIQVHLRMITQSALVWSPAVVMLHPAEHGHRSVANSFTSFSCNLFSCPLALTGDRAFPADLNLSLRKSIGQASSSVPPPESWPSSAIRCLIRHALPPCPGRMYEYPAPKQARTLDTSRKPSARAPEIRALECQKLSTAGPKDKHPSCLYALNVSISPSSLVITSSTTTSL